MATDAADIRAWARENGYDVAPQGRISSEVRDAYQQAQLHLLPSPDDDSGDDDFDLGMVDIDEPGHGPVSPQTAPPGPEPAPEELAEDPAPAPIGKAPKGGSKAKRPSGRAPTVAVARDIHGKVGMMLTVSGQVWAARDPYCGGTFVNQTPDITNAVTDLILESPDLVAFFTGPAGGFMKWLNLMVALQPVGLVMWSHHVAHTLEEVEQQAPREYAA